MLDYKTTTFLTLCEELNYRKTAQRLNMTQPGVTQHIRALEKEYGCELVHYDGRTVSLTRAGRLLRSHLQKVRYDESWLRTCMQEKQLPLLRLGATKSIGDYMMAPMLTALLASEKCRLEFTVDNTKNLLDALDNGRLDLAVLEGDFDKCAYDWRLLKQEPFSGICAADSPLANRLVSFDEIKKETLFLREKGSGTRDILEKALAGHGYGIDLFQARHTFSSFPVIRELTARGLGITFAYESVLAGDPRLALFKIEGFASYHDLNFVFMKDSHAAELFAQYPALSLPADT